LHANATPPNGISSGVPYTLAASVNPLAKCDAVPSNITRLLCLANALQSRSAYTAKLEATCPLL
jgi:hypothetical protein